jgi:hypothetical protein
MAHAYSDPSREHDPHALPAIEVFELTATEVAKVEPLLLWRPLCSGSRKRKNV